MRCIKCGCGIGLATKFCPKCGTAVPPGQKKKGIVSFLIWFGVLMLLIPIMYYFSSHDPNAQNYTSEENLFGAIIVAVITVPGLYLNYKLIRYSCRRPAWGIPVLVILIAVPVTLWAVFYYPSYSQARTLARIQDHLSDITSAKLLGNSILKQRKTSGPSFDDVQLSVVAASEKLINLSVPDALKNYQAAAILWSVRIASAAGQPADWEKLKNQPDAFPLTLTDAGAKNYFSVSVKAIERLKRSGEDAIKNKDREAMRQIAADLLVQKHWLNAILYSQKETTVGLLVIPAFAASQQVPPVGKGMDVTCLVCNYPDFYKVHWTDKLRQQYGCDVRCHPKTKTESTEQQPATKQPATNDDEAKYADALASYTYKNVPKRAICIGNNVGGVFCVEEAVQSVYEIAASAVGFADNTKTLTADEWNNEYEDIDLAVLSADRIEEIGIAPSQPSAEGGHQEGGMGTIQQGEPTVAPKTTPAPKPSAPAPKPTTENISSGSAIQNLLKNTRATFVMYDIPLRCTKRYYPDTYNENRDWTDTMPIVFKVKYGFIADDFPGSPDQYVDASGKVMFVRVLDKKENYSWIITNTLQFTQEGQKIKLSGTEVWEEKQTFSSGARSEQDCTASYSGYLTIVNYDP